MFIYMFDVAIKSSQIFWIIRIMRWITHHVVVTNIKQEIKCRKTGVLKKKTTHDIFFGFNNVTVCTLEKKTKVQWLISYNVPF